MQKVIDWFIARIKEPSTWAGIAAAAGAVGVSLESNTSIVAAVVAAFLAVVKSEK